MAAIVVVKRRVAQTITLSRPKAFMDDLVPDPSWQLLHWKQITRTP